MQKSHLLQNSKSFINNISFLFMRAARLLNISLKLLKSEDYIINTTHAVSKINKCKIYALKKVYKIVSRFSTKAKTSNKLFFRITYDLI